MLDSRPTRAATVLCLAIITLAAIGGCSSDDDAALDPSSSNFVDEEFAAIPRFPNSEPAGSLTRSDRTVTRSFAVELGDPLEVLDWYDDRLETWTVVEEPHAIGEGPQLAARARWRRDRSTLTISAQLAPGLGDDERTVQYNLQMRTP